MTTDPAIDRAARDVAAEKLGRYYHGEITNFDLEESEPATRDRAVVEAYRYVWLLYDDVHESRLASAVRHDPAVRPVVDRWIAFLKTDLPYAYPHGHEGVLAPALFSRGTIVASFGVAALTNRVRLRLFEQKRSEMAAVGDPSVWPFLAAADMAPPAQAQDGKDAGGPAA